MLERIAFNLHERCGIGQGALLVVGVSGGPDSLCLLHALCALGYNPLAAHFDHQLRPESGAEAEAVERIAKELGLGFVMERADVRKYAEDEQLSIEEASRELRYRFLFAQGRKNGAQAVAVGHTADDQVETVLMHLIRGAGTLGLAGMQYRTSLLAFDASIPLIRPLLDSWHAETQAYCRANALTPQMDLSNESLEYFRNQIRHRLLPLLETYNPRVRESIWRAAEVLTSDAALVEQRVDLGWSAVILRQSPDFVCFDAVEMSDQSLPMRRRLILNAARHLNPRVEMTFDGLERAARFAMDGPPSHLDIGQGLVMDRQADGTYIRLSSCPLPTADWPQMDEQSVSIPKAIPSTVPLMDGWSFSAEYLAYAEAATDGRNLGEDSFMACLDADTLPEALELRPPRAGDRFRPLGMNGKDQKLSDSFVNARVPARLRGRWPLLCSGDVLIWVPGLRPAEPFKLTAKTRRLARFRASRAA